MQRDYDLDNDQVTSNQLYLQKRCATARKRSDQTQDEQQCQTELDTIHLINHCFHFIVILQKTLSDSNETLFVEYG